MKKSILVLDCGATNVKACLVDVNGDIISSMSLPNSTVSDPNYEGGLIWDIEEIWNKLADCAGRVVSNAGNTEIIAVTVTTFGVDGAAVKKNGALCYPVISWQCNRTEVVERNINKYFDPEWLYRTTGLQSYHFNTLYKLIWLKENRADVLQEMDYYLMMPSLILHRLTGEFVTDATMAGTSMLTDLKKRNFSDELLQKLGLTSSVFPAFVEPGTVVGKITQEAARELGIKPGIPAIAAGHDTQFAILASGAGVNQPVLSSGTWEILMVRSQAENLVIPSLNSGLTVELDAQSGLVNPGIQWVASGVLEWISRLLYSDLTGDKSLYSVMIQEAGTIPPGSDGVFMVPELFPGGFSGKPGNIGGLMHDTSRAHIYRAGLEALSCYLAFGLEKLQRAGNFQARDVICVGGGSKNQLWNQIKADVAGIPVKALDMKEATALGAAMIAFAGTGIFRNTEEAFSAINRRYEVFEPSENRSVYKEFYEDFIDKVFDKIP
ncbi:MAG: L-fuculokinase [Bacteroidales bacterium]|nr:L-fuculokinase [Bacteroidales bacterium]